MNSHDRKAPAAAPASATTRLQETRSDLLRAALVILTRDGEHGVTMVAVARQAKCSRRTVYHHFQDRADLLRCLHESVAIQLEDSASARRIPEDPFAFPVEIARTVPEIMRAETHNLIRDGRAHPHLAALEASLVQNEQSGRSLLQPGVDTQVAATLFMTAARIGADIFMSSIGDDDGARREAAARFTETLRHMLLHGMLDADKYQHFAASLAEHPDDTGAPEEAP